MCVFVRVPRYLILELTGNREQQLLPSLNLLSSIHHTSRWQRVSECGGTGGLSQINTSSRICKHTSEKSWNMCTLALGLIHLHAVVFSNYYLISSRRLSADTMDQLATL